MNNTLKSFSLFLSEAKQVGTLYHYTSLKFAEQIVTTDTLKKSKWNGEDADPEEYICFTRDKNFTKIGRGLGKPLECRFVIDGNKLSHKYKITPFNWMNKLKGYFDRRYMESEERILNQDITQLHKYVIRLEIFKDLTEFSVRYFMKTNDLKNESDLLKFLQDKVPYEVNYIE